jgi:type IV pilus assembly protein PilA
MQRKILSGFNLIELMIVLAIVAILSAIALPGLMRFVAKAKRTEAYVVLRSLYAAEKAYWIEHGTYSTALLNADGVGWKPEGTLQYTYGFDQGGEGKGYVVGKLKAPGSALAGTKATGNEFVIAAAADIDGDGDYDILTIDHTGTIVVVKDDLA